MVSRLDAGHEIRAENRRPVRVGLLGHWGGNIGHDIMALGVETLISAVYGSRAEIHRIEQHRPMEVYGKGHPLRHLLWLRHARGGPIAMALKRWLNKESVSRYLYRTSWVSELDVGIACGGPLITPGFSGGDVGLMYHHMFGAFAAHGRPVLNLSVGSCVPLERTAMPVAERDAAFYRRMFGLSSATTVRDETAWKLCAELGYAFPLVRDAGFVAGAGFEQLAQRYCSPEYVVINYQRLGANEDWGQGVNPHAWAATLSDLIGRLQQDYKVVLVCHDQFELALAARLAPNVARIRPRSMSDYANLVSSAIAGLCSRIHAAIPLASVGVPAVSIGTDTRLGTVRALDLPVFYVKDVSADMLYDTLTALIHRGADERQRLIELREQTTREYVRLIRDAVGE